MTWKLIRAGPPKVAANSLYIAPGSLWENGHRESFNGKLHDELLSGKIFYSLKEGGS